MSLYRRVHVVEELPIPSLSLIESQTLITFPFSPLDLLDPIPPPSPFHHLTQIHRYSYAPPPITSKLSGSDLYYLTTLSDRLSALESTVNRLVAKPKPLKTTWTAEINTDDGVVERKYQWTAKIKADDDVFKKQPKQQAVEKPKKSKVNVKNYKWTSEIKGRGEHAPVHKYSVEVSTGAPKIHKEKKDKKEAHRTVQIEEITANPGALVLKQVSYHR